jgi:spermidine/putrescine transport system permease protein
MNANLVQKYGTKSRKKKWKLPLLESYGILIYAYLYFPLMVIMIFSLNSSRSTIHFEGITLRWYLDLLKNSTLLMVLANSLLVSGIAVSLAVIIGIPAALFLNRVNFRGKQLVQALTMLPIILPGIFIGLSLLIFFIHLQFQLSMWTVILGHIAFTVAVVTFQVLSRLQRLSRNLENAAMDLGASPFKAFYYVTLPMIKRSIIGGALLAFTMSFDEIVITYFLTSTFNTLPIYLFGMLRFGLSPEVYAISTMVLLFSIVVIILMAKYTGTEDEKLIYGK